MSTERIAPAIGTIGKADLTEWIGDPALRAENAAERCHRANMTPKGEAPEDGHGVPITVLIRYLPISQP
jgi:hypothetical protein